MSDETSQVVKPILKLVVSNDQKPQKPKRQKKKKIAVNLEVQKLGYAGKPVVVCSIPQSKRPGLREFERINGRCHLSLRATDKDHVLPYGRDRIALYWLRSEVLKRNSNKIIIESVAKVLRDMGLTDTGKNRKWFKESILRCHHTAINFVEGDPEAGGRSRNEFIISEINGIFFNSDKVSSDKQPYIVMSNHFLDSGSIPIDLNFIARLGRDYKTMDFYTWLRARLFKPPSDGRKVIIFPINEFRTQFGFHDGISDKELKSEIKDILAKLKKMKFECIPCLEGDNIHIPVVPLRAVLSNKMQDTFKHLDKPHVDN